MEKRIGKFDIIGSVCGLIAVFVFRRNLAAEFSLANYFNLLPNGIDLNNISTYQYLLVFKNNTLFGLILTNFFDIVNVVLVGILMIPMYRECIHRKSKSIFIIMILSIISIIFYTLSSESIWYFLKSKEYFLTNDNNVKKEILNSFNNQAGKRILGSIGLFSLYSSGLLSSILFINNKLIGKFSFSMGIIANGIGLLYFPAIILFKELNYLFIVFAAPFTIIWYFTISLYYIRIKKNETKNT
jgi:hypothetical protein